LDSEGSSDGATEITSSRVFELNPVGNCRPRERRWRSDLRAEVVSGLLNRLCRGLVTCRPTRNRLVADVEVVLLVEGVECAPLTTACCCRLPQRAEVVLLVCAE
jgi:hypothetical protein